MDSYGHPQMPARGNLGAAVAMFSAVYFTFGVTSNVIMFTLAIGTIPGASARSILAAFCARLCAPPGGIEENEWRAVVSKEVSP